MKPASMPNEAGCILLLQSAKTICNLQIVNRKS